MTGASSSIATQKTGSTESKNSPPTPRRINGMVGKNSPPTPHKITASPPVTRKSSGIRTKTSPQYPRKISDTRQPDSSGDSAITTQDITSASRTVDLPPAGDKSKPVPPKKPLPSLPKGMALPGQKPPGSEALSSKPPLPQKPPPELGSSPKKDCPQSSVAALAQKLSTIPVFPFRDNNTGKTSGSFPSPGTSPRASPLSSPRPSPRNLQVLSSSSPKPLDVGKPNPPPRPGVSQQKSSSQPSSPRLGNIHIHFISPDTWNTFFKGRGINYYCGQTVSTEDILQPF